jgi:hypothetical protein
MRSHGNGGLSTATQVKVSSPEMFLVALGQRFHFLEASIGVRAIGERMSGVPGSESAAGRRTVHSGTWENRTAAQGCASRQGVEETVRRYGGTVVGPTRIRSVAGVIPGGASGSLEGVGGSMQRDEEFHARH